MLVFLGYLVLNGCASRTVQISRSFQESEFIPYQKQGDGSINGQVFLKTRGGEIKYGAGNTVTLIPDTPYTREIWNYMSRDELLVGIDGRWLNYVKETTADANGNFEFKNLPAGSYFLKCPVFWEVPNSSYGLTTTGSVVKKSIKLSNGEAIKIVLTE